MVIPASGCRNGGSGTIGSEDIYTPPPEKNSHYIATCMILQICLVAKRRTGARVSRWWWEQDSLDLGLGEGSKADLATEAGRDTGLEMEAAYRRGYV